MVLATGLEASTWHRCTSGLGYEVLHWFLFLLFVLLLTVKFIFFKNDYYANQRLAVD